MLNHLTRLFPKIKINLNQKPSNEEILKHGFDIKITQEIKDKLNNLNIGDYLVVYPKQDEFNGQLIGLNLKQNIKDFKE